MTTQRKPYERNPISMPALLQTYLGKLLTDPEMSSIGITSAHQLARTCFDVYLQRLSSVAKENTSLFRPTGYIGPKSIAIPQKQITEVQKSLDTNFIRNVMWYSHTSHILNALFRSLLSYHVPTYDKMYRDIFDINIEDLKAHKAGRL